MKYRIPKNDYRRSPSPNEDRARLYRQTDRAYSSGLALERHTQSAHNGLFVETCNACREIRRRMEDGN